MDHLGARLQAQRLRFLRTGLAHLAPQHDRNRQAALAVGAADVEEAEQRMVAIMGGDRGPLALLTHHHVLGHQLVERLAQGADADLISGRQRRLAGDEGAGRPLTCMDALHQQVLDLHVQRLEGRGLLRVLQGVGHGHLSSAVRVAQVYLKHERKQRALTIL
ncbi:hypothetical protein D3C76_1035290 [compost metagenome]